MRDDFEEESWAGLDDISHLAFQLIDFYRKERGALTFRVLHSRTRGSA